MSLPIVFRDAARAEFDAAVDWYETQRAGLGSSFIAEIQRALDAIVATPLAYRVVLADVRRIVVRRFTYSVFYRVHGDRIEVIAVFHASRDPTVWRERVGE